MQPETKTKTKIMVALGAAVLCAGSAVLLAAKPQNPSAQRDAAQNVSAGDSSTSLADQTDLTVTVYNSNIALVRDVRNISIPSGAFRLKFMDIAATVNPATVHFRSLTDPTKLEVTEQNYEYDLLDPAKLLHKYVGKEITLERSYFDNNGRSGIDGGADFSILALEKEKRFALMHDDLLHFSDEDGVIAGILRAVQTTFQVS